MARGRVNLESGSPGVPGRAGVLVLGCSADLICAAVGMAPDIPDYAAVELLPELVCSAVFALTLRARGIPAMCSASRGNCSPRRAASARWIRLKFGLW
jgi:hypothetical protein